MIIQNTFHLAQLPTQTHYGHLGWATQRYPMGSEIYALSYHPRDVFIVGTGVSEEYHLPDDTYHYDWAKEDTTFRPHVEQGIIKVMDAKTWTVIDE